MGRRKQHGSRVQVCIAEECEARDISINHLLNKAAKHYLDQVLPPLDPQE